MCEAWRVLEDSIIIAGFHGSIAMRLPGQLVLEP